HWQLLANPAANDKSSSVSRQPDAPRPVPLRRAQTPPRQSPASARCSTDAAARDRPVPRRSPLHPSLAPVQTPVFAPVLTSPIKSQIARRSSADGYVQTGKPRLHRRKPHYLGGTLPALPVEPSVNSRSKLVLGGRRDAARELWPEVGDGVTG